MVQTFRIPWAAWYGDQDLALKFPDTWDVKLYNMRNAPEISREEIESAINNPIGTPTLKEIAQGKQNAVIAIEDISRPSYLEEILNIVLDQLNNAGINDEKITIVYAIGSHRPLNRQDSIKKVGLSIVERLNIENHHPYENLIYEGESNFGTQIYLNKTYHSADVKIAIGSVIPHPLAGFGGGAKIILPGICGIQTLEENHKAGLRGIGIGVGIVTELRKDIENVCKKVGLDFSINIVSTMKRGIAGVYAGDFIEAHRKAMDSGKIIYSTDVPSDLNLDIGFFNLYPEDTELSHAIKGFNFIFSTKGLIHRNSSIIFLTAASEGRGFHSLQAETGAKLYKNWGDIPWFKGFVKNKNFGIYSPNVNRADILHFYPRKTIFSKNFDELIRKLEEIHGKTPKVGIFPCSIQLPKK
ncbi:MAG: lactate racemase domain-containing protein [Candidatus Thorarchaeota archaeon]